MAINYFCVELNKGRFTRWDFVAYDKLTTRLRHESLRVNQTYNSLNGPKSCRRPVVSYKVVPCKSALTNTYLSLQCDQPRSQGLSSYHPIERRTLGTRLQCDYPNQTIWKRADQSRYLITKDSDLFRK